MSADITLDDNGGGIGWFFDPTPLDDAEFTAIANSGSTGTGPSFHASFVDIAGGYSDFYRTIVHEIGHAVGLASTSPVFFIDPTTPLNNPNNPLLTYIGPDPRAGGGQLYSYHRPGSALTATITTNGGRHLYEVNHPNDLMNPGRIVPVGTPRETLRQFISDFDVQLLDDAYDYGTILPSTFNTAHVVLDSQTGTLLVQGGVTSQGFGQIDTITIDMLGTDVRVRVNATTELVPAANVTKIILARNGGTDVVAIDAAVAALVDEVDYVVSTNQDNANAGTVGDGLVDLSAVIPGNQVALRAAIIDANGTAGGAARGIYIPRGNYRLSLTGANETTFNAATNDLEILTDITILGSGAGASVIDASALNTDGIGPDDRIFHVDGAAAALTLSGLTLTGATTTVTGGGILSTNNSRVELDQVAVVGNTVSGAQTGGGIRSASGSTLIVRNSVFTGNSTVARQRC